VGCNANIKRRRRRRRLPWNYPMETAYLRFQEPCSNQEGIFEVAMPRNKYTVVLGNYVRI
jgi:hypothetical protein